jgi:hypothetical protein
MLPAQDPYAVAQHKGLDWVLVNTLLITGRPWNPRVWKVVAVENNSRALFERRR